MNARNVPWPRRGLYLLTPDGRGDGLAGLVAPLLPHCALLQYRDKDCDADMHRANAVRLRALCAEAAVPFLVNDDVALAHDVGADGVHLGAHDGSLASARWRLGDAAILGASCYDSLDRGRAAAANGADYLAFGALFPSATKPHARRATPALLRDAKALGLPLVAIGGITADNARIAIDAGADFVAVIAGVFDAPDPVAAARAIAHLFE